MLKLVQRSILSQSTKSLFQCPSVPQKLVFQCSSVQCSSQASSVAPSDDKSVDKSPDSPLEHFDYFGVSKLFTVKTLFDNRMHLGHSIRSLTPQMAPFVYGSRMDMCVIDLDQTAMLLRQALNFTAHVAYKGGIVLFVCRQPR